MQVHSNVLEVRASTHDWKDKIQFLTVVVLHVQSQVQGHCVVKLGAMDLTELTRFLTGKAGTVTTYPMGLWGNERP